MKKHVIFLVLLSLSLLFAGCQNGNTDIRTTQTPKVSDFSETSVLSATPSPEASEIPSPSETDAIQPPVNGLFSHSIKHNETTVTLSLGMTFKDVTAQLDQAGITYSDGNHWADAQPDEEVSGISLTESVTCEYLDFSDDDKLDYMQWILVNGNIMDGDEGAFPGCVTSMIETYGFLPLYYHSESGNDAVEFPLDGGYYTQSHDDSSGEVIASLSYEDPFAWDKPSEDYALLLSEDSSYAASGNAIDVETVLADIIGKYGETDKEGSKYSYSCEGTALYNQQLYYSIRWSTLVEDEGGGGHSSYNEQIYVSLDGKTMLRGNHNEILTD